MTRRRAALTQAEIARAIRAAAQTGTVAVQTPIGIAFLPPGALPQTVPVESNEAGALPQTVPVESSEANTCDEAFC